MQAQYVLGNLYLRGEGVEKDLERAAHWFVKGADQVHKDAQFTLGIMHDNGEGGLPVDQAKALEWFRKSGAQGYAQAQLNLGSFHFFGSLQHQLARLAASVAAANATSEVDLHLVHDDATLPSGVLHGAVLHQVAVPWYLPPIDARYALYWELLQQLDPEAWGPSSHRKAVKRETVSYASPE